MSSEEICDASFSEYEGFTIVLTAQTEYEAIEDFIDFETAEDLKRYLECFNDGQLMWFCVCVSAQKYGLELGSSYLGGCAYKSLEDFKKHSGYYRDMREEAVSEAKAKLAKIIAGECSDNP